YITQSDREENDLPGASDLTIFTKSLRRGVTTCMRAGYMTKGRCAMRGLLHGPLVSTRSAWAGGETARGAAGGPYGGPTGRPQRTGERLDRRRVNIRGESAH